MYHRTAFLIVSLSLAFGCASFSSNAPPTLVEGPGSTFHSAEAAAIDGLAWCARDARRDGDIPRLRIGVVRQVGEGYTYETPEVARRSEPRELEFVLRRDSAAHFHHYSPASIHGRAAVYERHSRRQRRVVDEIDPRHRPSYLLTPRLRVVAYHGAGQEPEVAQLRLPASTLGEALAAR